jgi:hypothetical protein
MLDAARLMQTQRQQTNDPVPLVSGVRGAWDTLLTPSSLELIFATQIGSEGGLVARRREWEAVRFKQKTVVCTAAQGPCKGLAREGLSWFYELHYQSVCLIGVSPRPVCRSLR